MTRTLLLAGFCILEVGFAAFGVWTWRRLWREGSSPYDRFVYRYGVRCFGIAAWILMSILFPGLDSQGANAHVVLEVLAFAIPAFPISLWAGYWWGRWVTGFFGVAGSD